MFDDENVVRLLAVVGPPYDRIGIVVGAAYSATGDPSNVRTARISDAQLSTSRIARTAITVAITPSRIRHDRGWAKNGPSERAP